MSDDAPATVDDFYNAVGRALSEWSRIEQEIGLIFSICVGSPGQEPALKAFWSLHSFEQRLQLTAAAFKALFHLPIDDDLLAQWRQVAKEWRDANDRRNDLAHGTVIRYEEGEIMGVYFCTHLYADPTKSIKTRIELATIRSYSDYFADISKKTHEFRGTIMHSAKQRERDATAIRELVKGRSADSDE